MNDEPKISGVAALAFGAAERQLERVNQRMAALRVYMAQSKFDNVEWMARDVRGEVQQLSRRLKHLQHTLRNSKFLPHDAPPPRPSPYTPLKPDFKVIK